MAIQNGYRYVKTVVDGDKILNDFGNQFRVVAQKPYKGNPEKGLAAGATVTLQIIRDNSAPIIDKTTGKPKDNNMFETFDATIIGATYPLPLNKGDYVALSNFMADVSYPIDFNFILRFGAIKKLQPTPQPQGHQGGKA